MRYITLTKLEQETLQEGFKNHCSKDFRIGCQAMFLSSQGWQVKQLAIIYQVRSRTIYTWMDRWEQEGICGLMIRNGRGRKALLSLDDHSLVDCIKKKPLVMLGA